MTRALENVDATCAALEGVGYVPTREIGVAAYLLDALEKPLLIEGPAGVGKTELAKALASVLERPLIRLQCYEGLDEQRALYEWEYGKQLLYTEMLRPTLSKLLEGSHSLEDSMARIAGENSALFDERFLLERPLLKALRSDPPAFLLIDEVDRGDPEFEALLLEILSDFQASIPELGTIRAQQKPRVILTTNGTREMTDALRRRCLYLYLDYPAPARELSIVQKHVPGVGARLAEQVVAFVERVRTLDLQKTPSIAETLDWARTLVLLSADALTPQLAHDTLGALIKRREDFDKLEAEIARIQ